MTGPDVNASNRLGREPQVEIAESAVGELPSRLTVAPISINLHELHLK